MSPKTDSQWAVCVYCASGPTHPELLALASRYEAPGSAGPGLSLHAFELATAAAFVAFADARVEAIYANARALPSQASSSPTKGCAPKPTQRLKGRWGSKAWWRSSQPAAIRALRAFYRRPVEAGKPTKIRA